MKRHIKKRAYAHGCALANADLSIPNSSGPARLVTHKLSEAAPGYAPTPTPPPPALRVSNEHAAVECAGFAADHDLIVLLDIAGHKTACKSIWASLVTHPRKCVTISGVPGRSRVLAGGGDAKTDTYQQRWLELPEVAAVNCVVNHARLLDPLARASVSALAPFYVIGQTQAEAARRAAHMLNAALELPILEAWADYLFERLLESKLIAPIQCGGDVARAYKVIPDDARIREMLTSALSAERITL